MFSIQISKHAFKKEVFTCFGSVPGILESLEKGEKCSKWLKAFVVVWQSTLSFRQTLLISCKLGMDATKTVQRMFGKQSYQNPIFSFSLTIYIVWIGVSTPPQKHHPLFLANPSPLNRQTVQAPPLFRQSPSLYWFFVSPLLKTQIFQWTSKMLKFFILNTILSFKSN